MFLPGTYTVTVVATDKLGNASEDSIDITVTAVPESSSSEPKSSSTPQDSSSSSGDNSTSQIDSSSKHKIETSFGFESVYVVVTIISFVLIKRIRNNKIK